MSETPQELCSRLERELRDDIEKLVAAKFRTCRVEQVRAYIDAGTIVVHFKDAARKK